MKINFKNKSEPVQVGQLSNGSFFKFGDNVYMRGTGLTCYRVNEKSFELCEINNSQEVELVALTTDELNFQYL